MEFVGAIDNGTSSSRFILFDIHGQPVQSHQIETKQFYPQSGWVEHDPMDILDTVQRCIEKTIAKASIQASQVKGIGITNQRETTIVWDRISGKPLHNAIVWLDTRTRELVDSLISKFGDADYFRKSCGLPLNTYFSAMKLLWLIKHIPAVEKAVRNGTAMFGTVDCWLIWKLTGGIKGGVHATDISNASRTMLMNLSTLSWDKTTCQKLDIPLSILPKILSNSEIYGNMANGCLKGVPLSGCLGDQHAALLGQLCFEPGNVKNTYGTGCFMLMNTGTKIVPSVHGLLTTPGFQLGPNEPVSYALEGSIAVAGSAVKWLRDQLKIIKSAKEINELAKNVSYGCDGVYFVPAFAGLFSPYWRTDARGVIVGLTHYTTNCHFARAALEAAAYQTNEVLDAMAEDSGIRPSLLRVDGGMAASDLMLQFQSDLLGVDICRPNMMECTAAGAAFAAGLAVGFWKSKDELINKVQTDPNALKTFSPKSSREDMLPLYAGWKRAVTRSFDLATLPSKL